VASEVIGLDDFLSKMDGLQRTVSRLLIARAVKAGAMVIRDEAERLAPHGETGRLADEEMVTVTEQTSSHALAKIGPSKKAFYGLFQELGTAHHAPQAFLEPAFESTVAKAIRVVGDTLANEIDRAVK
jgi:HK97 gp10 family phage protein